MLTPGLQPPPDSSSSFWKQGVHAAGMTLSVQHEVWSNKYVYGSIVRGTFPSWRFGLGCLIGEPVRGPFGFLLEPSGRFLLVLLVSFWFPKQGTEPQEKMHHKPRRRFLVSNPKSLGLGSPLGRIRDCSGLIPEPPLGREPRFDPARGTARRRGWGGGLLQRCLFVFVFLG